MVDPVLWESCLNDLLGSLSADDAVGLRSLGLVSIDAHRALLEGIPDSFWKTRIERKLLPLIREKLQWHFSAIEFSEQASIDLSIGQAPRSQAAKTGPKSTAHPKRRRTDFSDQTELPLELSEGEELGVLEPRFNFENFQEGPSNRFALKLAQQVAQDPGKQYNPLVLVGKPGHGKTHLLHAIGSQLRDERGLSVTYNTAEGFANDIWEGIRLKKMNRVRARYRQAEVLLLDGLEFLQITPKAQLELCHTIDDLHTRGRQICFAIDRYPKDLEKFDPALRSRLDTGIIAELGAVEQETRMNIITRRASSDGIELPETAARMLSTRITSSPRKLEGALLRIGAYAALMDTSITMEFAAQMAQPFIEDVDDLAVRQVAPDTILGHVCSHFGLPATALASRIRERQVVRARRVAIYLLRECAGLSYADIGALLGKRSHATILQADRKFREELSREPVMQKFIDTLKTKL